MLALALAAASIGDPPDYDALVAVGAEQLAGLGFEIDVDRLEVEVRERASCLEDVDAMQSMFFAEGHFEGMRVLFDAFETSIGATDVEVRGAISKAVLTSLNAYYDPNRRTLVIFSDPAIDVDVASLVVHELVHAHRDGRQRIAAYFAKSTTLDGQKVRHAVLEGEAEIAALASALDHPGEVLASLGPEDLDYSMMKLLAPAAAPLYETGARFVLARFAEGGWEAVDRAFASPPPSSEQLLHPSKLGSDEPTEVVLPPWPADAPPATLAREDVVGEMALESLMRDFGVAPARAHDAAVGWDGDKLAVYTLEQGGSALFWRTVWDRDEDARQFRSAVRRPFAGDVRRKGRVVDLVWSEADGLARQLGRALRALPFDEPANEEDARTTAAIEERAAAARSTAPRLVDGRWHHPRAGLSLPAPDGWEEVAAGGIHYLMAPPIDGFRDNFVVSVQANPTGLDANDLTAANREYFESDPNGELAWIEERVLLELPALVREQRLRVGDFETVGLVAVLFRDESLIIVEMTTVADRWEELGPGFEEALEDLAPEDGN